MTDPIYHLVPAGYFYSLPPDQPYLPQAFAQDGFIHCTGAPELVHLVANRHMRGVPGDFLVLTIDPDRVVAPLKWEPAPSPEGAPAGTLQYPHIYGLLNRDAIVDIRRMRRHADGTFEALDQSLALHPSERQSFLTPRANDERTRAWIAAMAPLLRHFEQAEQALENARRTLAAEPLPGSAAGAQAGGHIGRMMAETRTRVAELDRQIGYFFVHGTLAGYETTPPPLAGAGPEGSEGEELAQLRAAAESALRELELADLDGATMRYLSALALSAIAAGYFIARDAEPPAPARLLPTLETHDAEFAGEARAALTVAEPSETRRILRNLFELAFRPGGKPGIGGPAADELQPSPD